MNAGRRREEWSPLFWAAVGGVAGAAAGISGKSLDAVMADVVPVAVSVATVLAGFQATAQSLLLVLIDSPAVRVLRASGHYERLVGYFWASVRSLSWFIAVALVCLLARACGHRFPANERTVPSILTFTFVLATASSYRMNRLMIKLMLNKNAGREAAGPAEEGK